MKFITGSEPQIFIVFSSWRKPEEMKKSQHEFQYVLNQIHPNAHKILLKDEFNTWFMRGINKKYNKISSILKDINKYIIENGITDINFLGASMGGFGSILYGKLYSLLYKTKTHVLSFSPQTNLIEKSDILKLNKWTFNCLIELKFNQKNKLLDLNNTLSRKSDCSIYCLCSEKTNFDMKNIQHINKHIFKWYIISNTECHNSARTLQNDGKLNEFILNYKNNNLSIESISEIYK